MIEDRCTLSRFLEAQEKKYKQALEEIKTGRKQSDWMWYIFPQYKGLGRSEMSRFYAIQNKEEALCYFLHPILGKRLQEIAQSFLSVTGKIAKEILGSPDHLKMRSSMTLFSLIQNKTDLFDQVLEKYFDGQICHQTRELLGKIVN